MRCDEATPSHHYQACEAWGLVVVGRGCFVALPTEWLLAMTTPVLLAARAG